MQPDTRPLSVPVQDIVDCLPQVAGETWVPLTGGRTNRLWRVGDLVVKIYDPAASSPLFPNDPVAEAAALRLGSPVGLAPTLRAEGPGWIVYDHLAGSVWPGGNPAPVAALLAAVHSLAKGPFRTVPGGSAAIGAQARAIAAACAGGARVLPPLPSDPGIAPVAARVIHGDAVAGNVVSNAGRLTLIDWQCPAMGDPVEDLAAFLSPAMQWLYRGAILTAAQEEAFLLAYPDAATVTRFRALKPLLRWRMAAHCLWRAERGAPGYAEAMGLELS